MSKGEDAEDGACCNCGSQRRNITIELIARTVRVRHVAVCDYSCCVVDAVFISKSWRRLFIADMECNFSPSQGLGKSVFEMHQFRSVGKDPHWPIK